MGIEYFETEDEMDEALEQLEDLCREYCELKSAIKEAEENLSEAEQALLDFQEYNDDELEQIKAITQ